MRAILAHEEHHRSASRPAASAVRARGRRRAAPLPPFASLAEREAALADLAADAASVEALGDRAPLASAFARWGSVAPERVDRLVGASRAVTIPSALLIAAATIVPAIAVLAGTMVLAGWHPEQLVLLVAGPARLPCGTARRRLAAPGRLDLLARVVDLSRANQRRGLQPMRRISPWRGSRCCALLRPRQRQGEASSDSRKLRDAVTTKGIVAHEAALQASARSQRQPRSRARRATTRRRYVGVRAAAAGLKVDDTHVRVRARSPRRLQAADPARRRPAGRRTNYNAGIAGAQFGGDFGSMYGTQSTDITAPGVGRRHQPAGTGDAEQQHERVRGGGLRGHAQGRDRARPARHLLFTQKFALAEQSGAGGALLFNEGQPGRTEPLWFDVTGLKVPWAAISVETATELANGVKQGLTGKKVRFDDRLAPGQLPDQERDRRDQERRSQQGHRRRRAPRQRRHRRRASTTTARALRRTSRSPSRSRRSKLRNKVRFVWFSAEESGLLGSEAYVAEPAGLRAGEDRGDAELRHGRLAELRAARLRRRSSDSEPPEGGAPPGSADIEKLFLDYFASQRLATEPTAFDGRSDYGPFIEAGIPAGGLFTGAEEIKTPEQVALYGGTAGVPFDICYHQGCDNLLNLSARGLDQMSDAAAHATITLAQATALPARSAATVAPLAAGGPRRGSRRASSARRRPRATRTQRQRLSLRREPLGPPAAVVVEQEVLAVVQAVGAALPQLDGVGPQAVAAPVVGARHLVREALLDLGARAPRARRGRAARCPARDAQAPTCAPRGRRREVGVGLLGASAARPAPRGVRRGRAAASRSSPPRAGWRRARGPCASRSW